MRRRPKGEPLAEYYQLQVEKLSGEITNTTFIVLDNARIHKTQKHKGESSVLAEKRIVPVLSPTLFPTSEHCRNPLEKTQEGMA